MKAILSLSFLLFHTCFLLSQSITQDIRGVVLDVDSKMPLIGATVELIGEDKRYDAITDIDGSFLIEDVPVGRKNMLVNYLGYEEKVLGGVNLVAGKELVLTIELQEAITRLKEIAITAKTDKSKPLNEMALLSGRSFSVEETQRYAASFLDPARMAQNYAGVTSAGDDLSNEIVIRGNSPTYVQWRLEGIQIPSPNHFANKGSSGGGISMISNNMMADSDFYTGAFPAEIGNVLGGAFDLNFRNGNNSKQENALTVGVLGLEASTEGPFSKTSKASYLFNYRYSVLEIISKIANLDFGDFRPNFQDLSFKINVPTQKMGTFSLFGLLARASAANDKNSDPSSWETVNDLFFEEEINQYGLVGLKHRYLFANNKTYLTTILSGSTEDYEYFEDFFDINKDNEIYTSENIKIIDRSYRLASTVNHKINAQNSLRAGIVLSRLGFDFKYQDRPLRSAGGFNIEYDAINTLLDDTGNTNMYQAFTQYKYRATEAITLNAGFHYMRLGLTGSSAIEPRAAIKWQFANRQSLAFSAGYHSQAEHLINYTLQRETSPGIFTQPNINLGLTRAIHYVLGYDLLLSDKARVKIETYYQDLFEVPVDRSFNAGSILNAIDVYDVLFNSNSLANDGEGRNIGIDVTLERFLSDGYYGMLTGSIFDSQFLGQDGVMYSTRFNSRFNMTFLAGKEIMLGNEGAKVLGINTKLIYNGGNRYTEFDFDTQAPTEDGIFKLQTPAYFRIDLGVNYKINTANSTHTISLEAQNLTNRLNVFRLFPDFNQRTYRSSLQNGLLPNLNYRLEF